MNSDVKAGQILEKLGLHEAPVLISRFVLTSMVLTCRLRCKLIGQIRKEAREQNVKGWGCVKVDESLMG